MFVINNSGGLLYDKDQFEKEKLILKNKFNKPTPYEIILNNISLNNYENIENKDNLKDINILNQTIKNIGNSKKGKKDDDSLIFIFVLIFFLTIIFIYILNLTYFISSSRNSSDNYNDSYNSTNDNIRKAAFNKKSKKKYMEDENISFNESYDK